MDGLSRAAAEIGRRAGAWRARVAVFFVLGGLGIGAASYLYLRDEFLRRFGMSSPIAVGTLTVLPALGLCLLVARPASHAVVRMLRPRWVEELSRAMGADAAELAELTEIQAGTASPAWDDSSDG